MFFWNSCLNIVLFWTRHGLLLFSLSYNLSCSHFNFRQITQKGSGMGVISISSTVNVSSKKWLSLPTMATLSVLFYIQIIIRLQIFWRVSCTQWVFKRIYYDFYFLYYFICWGGGFSRSLFLKFFFSLPYCAFTANLRLSSFLLSLDTISNFWKFPSPFK